jgi:2-amino-4-hydroxy-6-hydroxymethyldihydropteridine diphosphokinase
MATALVALGSNLGDRTGNLDRALHELRQHPAIRVGNKSRWFLTAPVGGPQGQDEFVNAAVRLETSLTPDQLLAALREVEAALGRDRRERWAARVVDLDLLLFDDLVIESPGLELPHPRMAFRRFVLEPAAEVAADMVHPLIGWSVGRLLEHLNTARNYVAVTGVPGVGKTELAQRVAETAGGRFLADPARQLSADHTGGQTDRFSMAYEQELLRQRAELLSREWWPETEQTVVSDFWIGQGLAYCRVESDDAAGSAFETAWGACQATVVPPKVLVLLDAPATTSAGLRAELQALVVHGGHGPFLELDATRPDWALVELKAAIDAMR